MGASHGKTIWVNLTGLFSSCWVVCNNYNYVIMHWNRHGDGGNTVSAWPTRVQLVYSKATKDTTNNVMARPHALSGLMSTGLSTGLSMLNDTVSSAVLLGLFWRQCPQWAAAKPAMACHTVGWDPELRNPIACFDPIRWHLMCSDHMLRLWLRSDSIAMLWSDWLLWNAPLIDLIWSIRRAHDARWSDYTYATACSTT